MYALHIPPCVLHVPPSSPTLFIALIICGKEYKLRSLSLTRFYGHEHNELPMDSPFEVSIDFWTTQTSIQTQKTWVFRIPGIRLYRLKFPSVSAGKWWNNALKYATASSFYISPKSPLVAILIFYAIMY